MDQVLEIIKIVLIFIAAAVLCHAISQLFRRGKKK